jgi:hypothetical protein
LIKLTDEQPQFQGVAAYFRVVKGKNNYASALKNGIRSRKQTAYEVIQQINIYRAIA